ncbi:Fibrinogen- domains (FReDs) [Branchiostoma belcheri]|nr:Fibrinogen- domains (FReDs) [Branchiostoma belcheri]
MASVLLLAAFLLCSSFPVGAQDTRTYCPGSCLREHVDKGYCAYTYVVPPGSRAGGCTPPVQLAETKEETGCMKNLDKTSFAGSRFEPPRQADRWRAGPIRTGSIIDTFVRIGSVPSATGDAEEIALITSRRSGYQAIEVTQMSGASRRSSCAVRNSPQLQRLIRCNQEPCLSEITQTAIRRISAECRREGSP